MRKTKIKKITCYYVWNPTKIKYEEHHYKIYYKSGKERTIVKYEELPETGKDFILSHFYVVDYDTAYTRVIAWNAENYNIPF